MRILTLRPGLAALALSANGSQWAKLCLEEQPGGGLSVISVVTRGLSDDATAYPVSGTSVFLKVARQQRGLQRLAPYQRPNRSLETGIIRAVAG